MIGQTISHYRILEKLGEGGMGVVYKAEDVKLKRLVALKMLPRQALATDADKTRFAHEARAAASLLHPNIATIFEFDEVEGQAFIAMEYIDGHTVKEKIKERPLPIAEAVNIAIATAEGLSKAHEKGITHRDIKSDNVMISRDGVVKIMDFGLAAVAGRSRVTKEGMTVGTVAYMSPEQALAEKLDHRTDIWSLGVVLYEMVTGKQPLSGDYEQAIIYRILNEEPEPITSLRSNVPMELERIVKKAMQKDREMRYQRVDEMLVDLKSLKRQLDTGSGVEVPLTRVGPKKKRIYLYGILAGLAVVGVLLIFYFYPRESDAINSLAVLPLSNLSGDTEQEYFSDGMTEALITDLAKIGPLRVISRTSVMRYKGTKKALPDIGRELDVDAIVEGSVMREQDRVRITVQLIHAPTDKHLWAESYERNLRDVLGLQREVARAIAQEIKLKLTPQQEARLTNARTVDPQVHEAYLKGLYHCRRLGTADKGIEHLKQTIKLDPTYAPAHSALGGCYANLGYFGILPPQEAFLSAKSAALKAIELDPMLADAHRVVAFVQLSYEWDWAGAEREFKQALELNPNDAATHHSYAHYLLAMGREEESLAESRRATELDPVNPTLTSCVGWHSLYARRYDNAVEHSLMALQLDPNNFVAHYYLGYAYEQQGKLEEAVAEFQSSITSFGGTQLGLAGLARAYARAGKTVEARKVLEELYARSKKGYVSAYEIAAVHNGLGEKDKTFDWLEKAYEERSSLLVHVNWDPRFENLRTDPRFLDLLHRMNFPKR